MVKQAIFNKTIYADPRNRWILFICNKNSNDSVL